MSNSTRQIIQQSQIPRVKDLCQALGFGNIHDRTEQDLKDSTQSWRKQYKTSEGIPGKDLTEWRTAKMQEGLWRMSKDYLERGGYGMIHWPSNGKASPRSVPEYPRDELRILHLLMQLFWRENVNQAHNAKFPDRGRRLREVAEDDRSSSPSTIGYPQFPVPSYKVVPQNSSCTPYRIAGAFPEGSPDNTLQPQPSFFNHKGAPTPKELPLNARTQRSEFSYGPSANDVENLRTQVPNTTRTPASTTQISPAKNREDSFEYHGSDSDVRGQAHSKPSKIVVLKANPQVPERDGIRNESPGRAPVANMQARPAKPSVTPTKLRPQQDKATPQSFSEPRESKRKDVDDDDEEDGDYTPQTRSKRHKATSRDKIDKPFVAKHKRTRHALSPVRESEERPIVRSIEHRGAKLPATSKTKRKPSTKASNIGQKTAKTTSSKTNVDINNLLDEAVEYIGTLERSRASPAQGVGAHAEKSPLSPTGDAQTTPIVKVEQDFSHTDSASRRATIDKAAALQIAAGEATPAPGGKPTVPVTNETRHPAPSSKSVHTTETRHDVQNLDARVTDTRPESRPPQHLEDHGRESQHMPSNNPSTKEQPHVLPARDLPLQSSPERQMPGSAQITKERHDSLPVQDSQKLTNPTQHRPAPKPQISYYVFAMRNGRLTLLQWPDGSLIGKTIDTLFEEVASLAGTRDIKNIYFKLTTSQKDAVCIVQRDDVGAFEVMKRKFSRLINEDLKTGNREFEIELDPGHAEPQGQTETEGDDIDPGFSFG